MRFNEWLDSCGGLVMPHRDATPQRVILHDVCCMASRMEVCISVCVCACACACVRACVCVALAILPKKWACF